MRTRISLTYLTIPQEFPKIKYRCIKNGTLNKKFTMKNIINSPLTKAQGEGYNENIIGERKVKKRIKIITIFIVGMIITGVISAYAATVISAGEVSYTSNGQTTLQGAIDDLYTKVASGGIDANSIDFGTLATNIKKTVLASKNGVCINRNGKLNCFKINNWTIEKDHIKQVFSDVSCAVDSSYVYCSASDFYCSVYSSGNVQCNDRSDYSRCSVTSDGAVSCN